MFANAPFNPEPVVNYGQNAARTPTIVGEVQQNFCLKLLNSFINSI